MSEFDIPAPDEAAGRAAQKHLDGLAKPVGALGRIEALGAWLSALHGTVPPHSLNDVRVVVFAGDHGVTRTLSTEQAGVSAYPREVTAAMVRAFLSGSSGVNVLASQVGARVRVADIAVDDELDGVPAEVTRHKIRRGSGALDVEDALLPGEGRAAFDEGRAIADAEINDGADLLIPGDMGIGNTTVAAALTAASLGLPPGEVAGTGTGIDDDGLHAKVAAIETGITRVSERAGDPFELLTALGSACAAATAGFAVQGALRRIPVLLDGVFPCAAALIASDVAPGATRWWLAGHRSTEPAQAYALKALGLEPIVDLELRLGEGSGAVLAVPTLRAAQAVLASMGSLADLELG